jgi:hypothetical protein
MLTQAVTNDTTLVPSHPRVPTAVMWRNETHRILRRTNGKHYIQRYEPQPNGHNWQFEPQFHWYRTVENALKALNKTYVHTNI